MNNRKELAATVVTVLIMWAAYYADNNLIGDNMILSLLVSLLGTVILLCVVFPVYWVTRVTDEGIKGLGITGRNLPLAVILSLILSLWRLSEIREYIGQPFFTSSILFNAFSIWEVLFIFGWLYTRYKRSFGELPAILLTSLCVGIYHIGTLETDRIISLCVVIVVCGVFYGITNSIFTVWPIYWAVGCSASTLGSGMRFSMEMVYLAVITFFIQIIIIVLLVRPLRIRKTIHRFFSKRR